MTAYTVKDWFANKVANEVGKNITICEVFAILKETEKAVYAMLNLGCDSRKTMWVPKSVLVEIESNYPVLRTDNYEVAVEAFKAHWAMFR